MNMEGLMELIKFDIPDMPERTKEEILEALLDGKRRMIESGKFADYDFGGISLYEEMYNDSTLIVNVMVEIRTSRQNSLEYSLYINHTKYDTRDKPTFSLILCESHSADFYDGDDAKTRGRFFRAIESSKKQIKDKKRQIKLANKKKNINVILFQSKLQIDCVNSIMEWL